MVATDDAETAFSNIDVAILVGAMPRREGMERKDLLKANARIFESQGKALDKFAKKTVKVRPSEREARLTQLCSICYIALCRY